MCSIMKIFIILSVLLGFVRSEGFVHTTYEFEPPAYKTPFIRDGISNSELAAISDNVSRRLEDEYISFMTNGSRSADFHQVMSQFATIHRMLKLRKNRNSWWLDNTILKNHLVSFYHGTNVHKLQINAWMKNPEKILGLADDFFYCTTCKAMVRIILRTIQSHDEMENEKLKTRFYARIPTYREREFHRTDRSDIWGKPALRSKRRLIKEIILDACERLNIQTVEVCNGLFDSNWPLLEHIITNTDVNPNAVCSLLFQFEFCQDPHQAQQNWTVDINVKKPWNLGDITLDGPKFIQPLKTDRDLHILHITDIHHDPLYLPGSLAECEEPLCCQRYTDKVTNSSKGAGYWGDYRDCDLPWHTVDQSLRHMRWQHGGKLDFIFQTGDVIDHMIWSTSIEKNKAVYQRVTERIYELFPNVPVYPCIGNHEPHPLNAFSPGYAPEHVNTHWLYEFLYKLWSKWLPADTKETILKGGYYTVLAKPGYRIISLNNNDCYTNNWWLFFNGTDMKGQLVWLHDTLLAAERKGEYVHILAHIPSGDSTCWKVWAREFNRIVERFHPIISGIFNGHSHADEMHVHYSRKGYPIALSFNGGSLTPWVYKNPNYRIYRAEPTKMEIVDHETWIFNLTEANLHGPFREPCWQKEYVFAEEFTDNLSPSGIHMLLKEMAQHPNLLRKYWRYKVTMSDPELRRGCDDLCLEELICRLATTVSDKREQCELLQDRLRVSLLHENSGKVIKKAPLQLSIRPQYYAPRW